MSSYVDSHGGKTNDDFRETSLEAMRYCLACGKRHDMLIILGMEMGRAPVRALR